MVRPDSSPLTCSLVIIQSSSPVSSVEPFRHSFILLANPDGTTHLTNHEEFSGGLTTLMQRFMKQDSDNGYTAFNAGLKRQVEDRATQQNRT
jgi:hypothetical protein